MVAGEEHQNQMIIKQSENCTLQITRRIILSKKAK